MKNIIVVVFCFGLGLQVGTAATPKSVSYKSSIPTNAYSYLEFYIPIKLETNSLQLHVRSVRSKNADSNNSVNVVCVHGMANNNSFFFPFADAVMKDHAKDVARVDSLSLLGHGESDYPSLCDTNTSSSLMPFGQLSLDDYVEVLRQALQWYKTKGISTDILVGHSMGGMIIQKLQQRLLNASTNGGVYNAWNVRGVLLLGPTLPENVSWSFAEGFITPRGLVSPLLLTMLPYIIYDACDWFTLSGTSEDYVGLFFTDTRGYYVEGTPEPYSAEAESLTDREAYTASAELGGLAIIPGETTETFERPDLDFGAFLPNKKTVLATMAYQEDIFMDYQDGHGELYSLHKYLLGLDPYDDSLVLDESDGYFAVGSSEAAHGCPYTMPYECAVRGLEYLLPRVK